MTTLLIACTSLPSITGGAERVAWELANKLAGRFEVHMLICGVNSPAVKSKQITLHYVPRLPLMTPIYSTIARSLVNKVMRDVSPDVVHTHMALPWGYVLRNAKSKRIVTCHGSDVYPVPQYPVRFFLKRALSAAVITVASNWLAKYTMENYGVKPIVIPNGVDTDAFRPLTATERRDNVVLFVGRFLHMKGVLDLIEAARILRQYEFWLVGSGPAIRINQKDLPNLKVIGFVSNADLVNYYAMATLCVFPSHRENFPMVGLEAMACGKAMVATNVGFSEFLHDGSEGILVKPHDPKSLADSIRRLMEDHELRKSFEKNARSKAERYDWRTVAEKYRALYETLLSTSA